MMNLPARFIAFGRTKIQALLLFANFLTIIFLRIAKIFSKSKRGDK